MRWIARCTGRSGTLMLMAALMIAANLAGPAAHCEEEGPHPPTAVEVTGTPPGIAEDSLQRALVDEMNAANLAGWHFVIPEAATLPPDRVDCRFVSHPYVGGTVRNFGAPGFVAEPGRHFFTVELRLYLGGDFQRLVHGQVDLARTSETADLARAVTKLAGQLLSAGP